MCRPTKDFNFLLLNIQSSKKKNFVKNCTHEAKILTYIWVQEIIPIQIQNHHVLDVGIKVYLSRTQNLKARTQKILHHGCIHDEEYLEYKPHLILSMNFEKKMRLSVGDEWFFFRTRYFVLCPCFKILSVTWHYQDGGVTSRVHGTLCSSLCIPFQQKFCTVNLLFR